MNHGVVVKSDQQQTNLKLLGSNPTSRQLMIFATGLILAYQDRFVRIYVKGL